MSEREREERIYTFTKLIHIHAVASSIIGYDEVSTRWYINRIGVAVLQLKLLNHSHIWEVCRPHISSI